MTTINQKEYLKKYLGIGKAPGEKKKKKKKEKNMGNRLRIIDDDADVLMSQEIQEDISAANEDAPQIVAVIDERPPSLRIDEQTKSNLWKPIGEANEVTHETGPFKLNAGFKLNKQVKTSNLQSLSTHLYSTEKHKNFYDVKVKQEVDISVNKVVKDKNLLKVHKGYYSSSEKIMNTETSSSQRRSSEEDNSPSRIRSSGDNFPVRRISRGNDNSPLRQNKNDNSPSRKKSSDDDNSPPRKRNDIRDSSPPRRRHMTDDNSPLRKRNDSKIDSPAYKQKRERDVSPPKKNKYDSNSPSQRKNKDSDYSPVRKRRDRDIDLSSPRKLNRYDVSPSRRKSNDDFSPPRQDKATDDRRRIEKAEEKIKKTLDGKQAGLQSAKDLVKETRLLRQKEDRIFANMSAEVSGRNAATVVRDRKVKDLEEEARQLKKEKETKEKYNRWGKGLKQVENQQEKVTEQLHEMSKPLARYADDEDLERYLKEQEREGDPMLAYIRKKKKKEAIAAGIPEKPMYQGEFMPNRFGIRPGYRWDGVDRSNGYEKKWFQVQNSKKATQEEAFKWSTEDM